MKRQACAIFFLTFASGAIAAADCQGAQDTLHMNACLANEVGIADATLNKTYQRVLATLKGPDDDRQQHYPETTKASVITAERAWIAYRDAQCKAVFNFSMGGTIRTMSELGCRKELTEQRTQQLERFLDPVEK